MPAAKRSSPPPRPYSYQAEPGGPVATRYLDFVYQPIKDADGRVSGIFVEGVDVTSSRTGGCRASRCGPAQG